MTTVLITFWAIPIFEGLPKRTAVELVPTHLRPLHRCSTDRAIDLSTALKFDAAGFGGRFGRMPVRLNLIAAVFASFVGANPTRITSTKDGKTDSAVIIRVDIVINPNLQAESMSVSPFIDPSFIPDTSDSEGGYEFLLLATTMFKETLYAAQMTRNILWDDERNVRLIGLFSPSSLDEHAALPFMFRFLLIALRTLLNPSFMLSIPAFITHIPGRGAILELITDPPPLMHSRTAPRISTHSV
ncbi:hypothetical protein B0H13DRAFT_2313057 [Mycena leptocephala]|nr:hypothetical protein B0H13DRAFT_2313057 [Mycena leptocephala]